MSVYVDRIRDYGDTVKGAASRWGSRWSHLIADSEDELHAFAARIGMKREWAQHPGTDRSHYDLVPRRRAMAGNAGAIEITDRQLVEIRRRQRANPTTTACELEKPEAQIPAPSCSQDAV